MPIKTLHKRSQGPLRHLDLFSGIGGFSLGLEATGGFETIGFSEIEPWCCAVLKKHWPKVKNYGHIGTIRQRIGCDIITGGFPCQPFSCAGQQRGAADDRHLWPAMLAVIAQERPAWVICENVAGIIDMELDNCCLDLEDEGYEVQPFIIPACAVDARHRRERVWIIAYRASVSGTESFEQCKTSSEEKSSSFRAILSNANEARLQGWNGKELSECEGKWTARTSSPFDGNTKPNSLQSAQKRKVEREIFYKRERREGSDAAGRPSEWPIEPGLGRVADGIPNRAYRLKAIGNAIVPQIAQILGEIILQTYEELPVMQ